MITPEAAGPELKGHGPNKPGKADQNGGALPSGPVGTYDHDDVLLERVRADGRGQVRVYRLDRLTVVLGRGSRADRELKLDACHADGVSVLRRRGGGCAVVVDPGNVIVAAALPVRGLGDSGRDIRRLCDWLISGLTAIGYAGLDRAGVCDLVQGGHKVGGCCIYRARDVLYFSGTVLVQADLRLIERYLCHPPREPPHRRGRSHSEFLRLLEPRGPAPTLEWVELALGGALAVPSLDL